jgi:hypothetical protein
MATFFPANDPDDAADGVHQGDVDNDIEAEGEAIDAEAILFDHAPGGPATDTSTEHLMANLKEAAKGVVGEKTLKGYDL